jgi:nicotinamidase-related amidase
MPIDLRPLLDPASTAVISLEVQENLLLPEKSMIPGLAAHAHSIGLIDRLALLYSAARRVGAQVVYVTDERRADGLGAADNLMVGRSMTTERANPGHGPIVRELTPHPRDLHIKREHGMTGFFTTPLDTYLRNLGISTVIVTGVSANIAVNGTSIEAMNLGYRVIVPNDAIAGDPPDYVEMLLRYTIRNVARVAPTQSIIDHWTTLPSSPPEPTTRTHPKDHQDGSDTL